MSHSRSQRSYFTPQFFGFLRQLKRNNNRPWFLKNKERYELLVRNPFLDFIGQLGPALRKISPYLWVDNSPTGGSMFRIYRDARFSKDKTPYKTHVAAWFPLSRQKDVHSPGFYIHLGQDEVFAGGGVWHPDAPVLGQIRDYLMNHSREWNEVLSDRDFRKNCELDGEKLQRPPKGYPPDHPMIETLKYKDFIYSTSFTLKEAGAPDFPERFAASCAAGSPLVHYLARALKLPW